MSSKTITLKLSGLHCCSCAVNIDLSLEDIPGIISIETNYAKSTSKIIFDPEKINLKKIKEEIKKLGYHIV
jgi:Cu+-exporting ATPase